MIRRIRELQKELGKNGVPTAGYSITKGNHIVFTIHTDDGPRKLFTSFSPSDKRSIKNLIASGRRLINRIG